MVVLIDMIKFLMNYYNMQYLQPNNTLQGGKNRIERMLGQVDFSRVFIFSLLIMFPVLMMAQASGGQIRRKVSTTSKTNSVKRETKKENRTDNSVVNQSTVTLIQPTPISVFSTYNVVVGSMGKLENASGLCQSLRDKGYLSFIYQDNLPEMTMYRVTIGSTNNEQEALRIRDQARNTYPDAWILYFVNGKQERYF